MPTVAAFAGRRIDAADAPVRRFPIENADVVGERIRTRFVELDVVALVAAAACGADLLAMRAAQTIGARRTVVLPLEAARFRETSVVDRPGAERWGDAFDALLRELPPAALIVLHPDDGADAYAAANARILDEAVALGATLAADVCAVVAWDGTSRGATDVTAGFIAEARRRRIPVHFVATT